MIDCSVSREAFGIDGRSSVAVLAHLPGVRAGGRLGLAQLGGLIDFVECYVLFDHIVGLQSEAARGDSVGKLHQLLGDMPDDALICIPLVELRDESRWESVPVDYGETEEIEMRVEDHERKLFSSFAAHHHLLEDAARTNGVLEKLLDKGFSFSAYNGLSPSFWLRYQEAVFHLHENFSLVAADELDATLVSTGELAESQISRFELGARSAREIIRRFQGERSKSLEEAERWFSTTWSPIPPPFVFYQALEQTASYESFWSVVRDLRNDPKYVHLRSVVARMNTADAPEKIEIAAEIEEAIRSTLQGRPRSGRRILASALSPVGKFLKGDYLEAMSGAYSSVTDLVSMMKQGRLACLFSTLHTRTPDIVGFFDELKRVFGDLKFTREQLQEAMGRAPALKV